MENFIYIEDRRAFCDLVRPLDLLDFEENELPIMPISVLGFFDSSQVESLS